MKNHILLIPVLICGQHPVRTGIVQIMQPYPMKNHFMNTKIV